MCCEYTHQGVLYFIKSLAFFKGSDDIYTYIKSPGNRFSHFITLISQMDKGVHSMLAFPKWEPLVSLMRMWINFRNKWGMLWVFVKSRATGCSPGSLVPSSLLSSHAVPLGSCSEAPPRCDMHLSSSLLQIIRFFCLYWVLPLFLLSHPAAKIRKAQNYWVFTWMKWNLCTGPHK